MSPLRVDGQRGHDEVGVLRHELSDQTGPLLLPRHVVPLDGPVVPLQADKQAVREIAGDAQVMEEIDAVAAATKTATNWS